MLNTVSAESIQNIIRLFLSSLSSTIETVHVLGFSSPYRNDILLQTHQLVAIYCLVFSKALYEQSFSLFPIFDTDANNSFCDPKRPRCNSQNHRHILVFDPVRANAIFISRIVLSWTNNTKLSQRYIHISCLHFRISQHDFILYTLLFFNVTTSFGRRERLASSVFVRARLKSTNHFYIIFFDRAEANNHLSSTIFTSTVFSYESNDKSADYCDL